MSTTPVTPMGNEERAGYCQDCGRVLTRETMRTDGSGRVFCEPCFQTRAAAAAAVPPAATYTEPFPPVGGNSPSPGLAALLGLIPGVGAMYNGQFAKGLAHIVIYALLQAMAEHSSIFGIAVAGWVCYQAFEAYHTAKARREGLPLPDPFGLNNIGERMGFAKGWPSGFTTPATPSTPYAVPPEPGTGNWAGYTPAPVVPATPVAMSDAGPWASVPATQPVAAYEAPAGGGAAPGYGSPTWTGAPVGMTPPPPVRGSRFPAGACWLIGLGLVFLLMQIEPEWHLNIGKIAPFILIGVAVWMFTQRMTGVRQTAAEGTPAYTAATICSLRAPVILFTVGVLCALQAFHILRWHQTWPVILIALGGIMLLERSVGNKSATPGGFDDGKGI